MNVRVLQTRSGEKLRVSEEKFTEMILNDLLPRSESGEWFDIVLGLPTPGAASLSNDDLSGICCSTRPTGGQFLHPGIEVIYRPPSRDPVHLPVTVIHDWEDFLLVRREDGTEIGVPRADVLLAKAALRT